MTTLAWHGRTYLVMIGPAEDGILLRAGNRTSVASSEAEAVKWLSCHSLRKGKARQLVFDACNESSLAQSRGNEPAPDCSVSDLAMGSEPRA